MDDNLPTHNQTIPTTVGALLTEECTIDPLSHLPSFLELTLVDVARNSGRRALSAAWGVVVAWLEGAMERLRGMERRLASRTVGANERSRSWGLRLLRVVRATMTRLARVRVKILRRLCHIFLRTLKTLGPELQALIMFAIDYNCMHYLAGATACEMVYGLKRSKIVRERHPLSTKPVAPPNISQSERKSQPKAQKMSDSHLQKVTELSKFEKTWSALLAALLPYWKERCDRCYSEWKDESNSGSADLARNNIMSNRSASDNSKEKFLQLYPYVHLVHEGSIFIYQFAYLMGYTPYWNFSMNALGVMLRRITVADVQQKQQQQTSQQKGGIMTSPKHTQPPTLQQNRGAISSAKYASQAKLSLPQILRGAVIFSVSYTLLSGWYSHFQRQLRLRRRRWIAGSDEEPTEGGEESGEGRSRKRSQLPIPPPPMPPNLLDETGEYLDKWSCPICKEPRINPTASTSGYVFCYKCLVTHLRQNGNYCPVTGMPCWANSVVRLFEPTASRRGAARGRDIASNNR